MKRRVEEGRHRGELPAECATEDAVEKSDAHARQPQTSHLLLPPDALISAEALKVEGDFVHAYACVATFPVLFFVVHAHVFASFCELNRHWEDVIFSQDFRDPSPPPSNY